MKLVLRSLVAKLALLILVACSNAPSASTSAITMPSDLYHFFDPYTVEPGSSTYPVEIRPIAELPLNLDARLAYFGVYETTNESKQLKISVLPIYSVQTTPYFEGYQVTSVLYFEAQGDGPYLAETYEVAGHFLYKLCRLTPGCQ